jgi:hypothetical protein
MDFKISGNLFKQTIEQVKEFYKEKFDPNRDYPLMNGNFMLPKGQLKALVEYLHWGLRTDALKYDEYHKDYVLPIKIAGWQKTKEKVSDDGKKQKLVYLSLVLSPDYKTKLAAEEKKKAAETPAPEVQMQQDPAVLNQVAASLADATGGQTVPTEDSFFDS